MTPIENRYEFSVLFDVTNGNPNGDPDADNMPRMDIETGHGIITDVCLKRKIRNYEALVKENVPGYAMYISSGRSLNQADLDALINGGIVPANTPLANMDKTLKSLKKSGNMTDLAQMARQAACAMYADVRTFGAVMVGYSAIGATQICGPVQLSFARSIDPVTCQEITITRQCFTTEDELEKNSGNGTIGHKHIVPYGLYRVNGFISAAFAQQTGFSETDKELLFEAIMNMFEHDRSASRGEMAVRKLVIFKHDSKYGKVPAHKLFERVQLSKKPGITEPRSFADYDVNIDTTNLPASVTIEVRD